MANLSELLHAAGNAPRNKGWIEALGHPASSFAPDQRFSPGRAEQNDGHETGPVDDNTQAQQLVADSFEKGRQFGREETLAEQEQEDAHRAKLRIALTRLDTQMAKQLKAELADAVIALCQATLAPAAIDPVVLSARCDRAVALLGENAGAIRLFLHPDDIASLEPEFARERKVQADPGLERGALRVENNQGGYCDGPGEWRRTLEEALAAC